jgi:ABC transporter substrate binding protein (PQQ-dependent alcohol dehydrogenase system)
MCARTLQLVAGLGLLLGGELHAQSVGGPPQSSSATIVYISREATSDARLSLTEPVVADYGWLGARFGVSELNANGRFLGKRFELTRVVVSSQEDLAGRARSALRAHPVLVVADLGARDLLALADLSEARDSLIIDARTSDDALRYSQCRGNVFHILPSWQMRASALSRFLVGRGWRRWLLLRGATAEDLDYAAALRRAALRFGAIIVAERSLPAAGASGLLTQQQLDTQLATLTRISSPYDLVVVTDSDDASGGRVMFNTAASRLVAGTQGLVATAWDPQFRDFAARGFAYRFAKFASREMSERDYGNWLAVTVLGEAVLRGGVHEPADVRQYLLSSRFSVAAFKGEPLKFSAASQQLGQPILLFGPKVLIALMPAEAQQHAASMAALRTAGQCDLRAASPG